MTYRYDPSTKQLIPTTGEPINAHGFTPSHEGRELVNGVDFYFFYNEGIRTAAPMSNTKMISDKFLQSKVFELARYYKWEALEQRSVEFLVIQSEQLYEEKIRNLESQLMEAIKIVTLNKGL